MIREETRLTSVCHHISLGPTALGLTTTLLSLKLSPAQIRRRLLLFSLSAPVGAILTYLIVYMFGGGRHDPNPNEVNKLGWWTGATLLFSVSLPSLAALTR